jgi:hypothetical protein
VDGRTRNPTRLAVVIGHGAEAVRAAHSPLITKD